MKFASKPSDHTILHDFAHRVGTGPPDFPFQTPTIRKKFFDKKLLVKGQGYLFPGYVSEILDTNLSFLLGQWLNLKFFGTTYLVGKM